MSTLTHYSASRRLLIVEGDRHNFDELRDYCVEMGYECEVALDPDTALGILTERQMDLAVVNAELSDDDEELIQGFKTANPEVALVIFNGTGKKSEQRRFRRMGASSYLSASSDLGAVIRAIERTLTEQ